MSDEQPTATTKRTVGPGGPPPEFFEDHPISLEAVVWLDAHLVELERNAGTLEGQQMAVAARDGWRCRKNLVTLFRVFLRDIEKRYGHDG